MDLLGRAQAASTQLRNSTREGQRIVEDTSIKQFREGLFSLVYSGVPLEQLAEVIGAEGLQVSPTWLQNVAQKRHAAGIVVSS